MASPPAGLVGGVYSIDFTRPLEGAAPPGHAFAASALGQGSVMAVPVSRGWPARGRTLAALGATPVVNLLWPMAHGAAATPSGEDGYFIICPAPPGPSLQATLQPWSETELIEQVLKPAALVLVDLEARGVTHRSIRPDNLFQGARGTPVSLGCAWAAPPACHQPGWIEPAYAAACIQAGRGNGTIADDVYALGAVLVLLALGHSPVEGLTDAAVLHRKLENGSYATLAGSHRLPAGIAELVRGMLADDPDHRPSPALLATPAAARARRIAARPIRRAQRPIEIGACSASTARSLGHALQRDPKAGVAMLRNGVVDRWLRRGLGDGLVAAQLDEAIRLRDMQANAGDTLADPALIASAVALLDPAAPLVWRSVTLWPDGLGAALDHARHHQPDQTALLAEIALANVVKPWVSRREAPGNVSNQPEIHDLRSLQADRRKGVAPLRLAYSLNPLSPCDSPMLKRVWVTRLADLLLAMEQAAATRPPGSQALLDVHVVAFIAARRDERLHAELGQLATDLPLDDPLAHVRLVARLQEKLHTAALPHLCAWAVEAVQPQIQLFSSRTRRTRMASDLAALAKAGHLPPIATLLDAKAEQVRDREDCATAQARLADITLELANLAEAGQSRAGMAQRVGHDVAGGIGALACLAGLAWAIFA